MTPVDEILMDCGLTQWRGDPKRCRWCDKTLRYPRRVWCSDWCAQQYAENHVWAAAKEKARGNGGCVYPPPHSSLLDVDHIQPCDGKRTQGCHHHQANLRVACQAHHAARHRSAA